MKLTRCLALLLSTALLARADLLPPSQDTSSSAGKLTPTTGKATTLPITSTRKAFVMFDLGALPEDVHSANIAHARLRIFFPTVTKAGDLTLHKVTSAWDENAAAALEPSIDPFILETILKADVVAKKFVDIDVTLVVQAWLTDSTTNFGFAFESAALPLNAPKGSLPASVSLGSKEGPGSGYPCMLEVEIDSPGAASIGSTQLGVGAALGNLVDASITSLKLAPNLTLTGTTIGTFAGDGSLLTNLNVGQSLPDGSVGNVKLTNSAVTINHGAGLTGGGLVPLGGSTTLSLGSDLILGGLTTGSFSGSVLLPAGTINAAPLRMKSGASLTNLVFGAVEFDGLSLFLTTNSTNPVRRTIAFTDSIIGNGQLGSDLNLGGVTTGSFSGVLNGNASTATSATTAGSAITFTGNLLGDVTGTQGATVVSSVGGLPAASVAAGATLAGAATGANTPGTIVKRDAGGSFIAGTITATGNFNGDGSGLTNLTLPNGSVSNVKLTNSSVTVSPGAGLSGGGPVALGGTIALSLGSDLNLSGTTTLPAGTATVAPLKFATGANLTAPVFGAVEFDGTNLLLTNNLSSPVRKTIAFTDSTITTAQIAANAVGTAQLANGAVTSTQLASGLTLNGTTSGNFSGPLNGNASSANSAVLFTGALTGDVTGSQSATIVSSVGGSTAASVATGAGLANSAASLSTPGALVKRDGSGNFTAGTITANLTGNASGFTGNLVGDVTGTQAATVLAPATVTGKTITGFVSAPGVVAATDTLLVALNKLNGNDALKAPLASPSFTGTTLFPAGTTAAAPLKLQTGFNLTTLAFGAVEFDGTSLFLTNNSVTPVRKTIAFTDSTVTTAQIAPNAVGTGQLAANAVGTAQLANGAVGSTQLASGLTLNGNTNGTFVGGLTGNVTGNVSGTAASFTGALSGDVTGSQTGNSVATVGGATAANVANGANLANAAASLNTLGAIVKRDGSGNFTAGTITANLTGLASSATTALNFSNPLGGEVTGNQGTTVLSTAAVTGKVLTGFNSTTGAISATDTLLTAINKLNGNVALKANTAAPTFTGTVTAGAFVGDGSGLTGVTATSAPALARNPQQVALLKWGPSTINNTFTGGAGLGPNGVCFDGTYIWTANQFNSSVSRFSASTGAFLNTYQANPFPHAICFDGTFIWVTNYANDAITKINASTGSIVIVYATGTAPYAICFDGTSIWVANSGSNNSVMKINPATGAILATTTVGTAPRAICFDGANIWVGNTGSSNVTKLSASTGAVVGTYAVGSNPNSLCFDGSSIWVANQNADSVTKLDAATGTTLATIAIGGINSPAAICFDGGYIWILNTGNSTVTKHSLSTGAIVGGPYNYPAGGSGGGRALCFDGLSIWLTLEGGSSVMKF